MTDGVVKTQGTRIFVGAAESEIFKIACPTGVSGLGGAADQIETTCLESAAKEFVGGLENPGAATIPFNVIPRSASHQALFELKRTRDVVPWMVILSDNPTGEPTEFDTEGFLVSPGPTSFSFKGYVADINVDISTNEIVRGTLSLQVSGEIIESWPTADLP